MTENIILKETVDNYIKYVAVLKHKRAENVENIIAKLRFAQSRFNGVTDKLIASMNAFNETTNIKDKSQFKIQFGTRAPLGGPLGPVGPYFIEYTNKNGKRHARRRKFFRSRELKIVYGVLCATEIQQLVTLLKKYSTVRTGLLLLLNKNSRTLWRRLSLPIKQKPLSKERIKELRTKSKIMLDATDYYFDEIEILIRRMLHEVEDIDTQIEEVGAVVNIRVKPRNGAIRLSWQTLPAKHIKNRVTGPPGPVWSYIFYSQNGARKKFRIKRISKKIIQSLYSGRHSKKLLLEYKTIKDLTDRRKSINAVIVKLTRMIISKEFIKLTEADMYE